MITVIATAGLLFVGYALASLAWAPSINTLAVANLAASAGAFCWGLYDPRPERVGYWFVVLTTFALVPVLSVEIFNQNVVACVVVIALGFALLYNYFWFIPVALLSLFLLETRGAIIAAGAIIAFRFRKVIWLIPLMLLIVALLLVEFSPSNRIDSIYSRLGIWQDTLNNLTLFGHGFGSFQEEYMRFAYRTNAIVKGDLVYASHAYNDTLELLFELGVGTIPLWFLIAFGFLGPKEPLLAFAVLSLAYFPFSIPIVAQAFAYALGTGVRNGTMETCRPPLPSGKGDRVGV